MGQFDAARWNAFYKWDKENGILKEDLTDKGFTNEFSEIMTEIRLEHVSYAYGQDRILEDINLKVTSGEVVSILGPSGVGKDYAFQLNCGDFRSSVRENCP